jgi:TolA-binding protein
MSDWDYECDNPDCECHNNSEIERLRECLLQQQNANVDLVKKLTAAESRIAELRGSMEHIAAQASNYIITYGFSKIVSSIHEEAKHEALPIKDEIETLAAHDKEVRRQALFEAAELFDEEQWNEAGDELRKMAEEIK